MQHNQLNIIGDLYHRAVSFHDRAYRREFLWNYERHPSL